jgi:hypothetical protein
VQFELLRNRSKAVRIGDEELQIALARGGGQLPLGFPGMPEQAIPIGLLPGRHLIRRTSPKAVIDRSITGRRRVGCSRRPGRFATVSESRFASQYGAKRRLMMHNAVCGELRVA